MNIYTLFQFLFVISLLVSTAFDILHYVDSHDTFILLSFISLGLTSIIPLFFRKKDLYEVVDENENLSMEENQSEPVILQRNFYFVPATMFVLVFKAMALANATNRQNMTISVWSYIIASFTAHYMRETKTKDISWTFFIVKPLTLTLAFVLSFRFHEHTVYEFYMKYLLLTALGLYAYSELLISFFNTLVMENFCPMWQCNLIKPLHLVTACISLSISAFFYKENIIPLVCVFVVVYLKHLL